MDSESAYFTTFLGELRRGKTLAELDESLRAVVAAVRETGKPGKLSLTITIKANGAEGVVDVMDAVKTTIPQHDRGKSIFFATPENHLERNLPRQRDMSEQLGLDDAVVPLKKQHAR